MSAPMHVGGAGADIVLLHGLGGRWQIFTPIIGALEEHHRVHALDLPGFGARGSDPSPDGGIGGLADWVSAELSELGIVSPHIVGSSMGAGIALELARRRIAGAVTAFAPIGFWSTAERCWCVGLLSVLRAAARTAPRFLGRALHTRSGRTLLLFPLFGKPAKVDPQAATDDLVALAASTGFAAARSAFKVWGALPAAGNVPTTMVWGSRDHVLRTSTQSRRARRSWVTAEQVLLVGCGHLPFSDAPERCVEIILDRHPSPVNRQDTR